MRWEKNGNNYWSQKTFSSQVLKQAMTPWHLWRQSTHRLQDSAFRKKKVHLLHSSSRSVSCCAWLKEQSGAQTKQDWTSHRQAPCTPEWQCWSSTKEPSTSVMFYLYNSPRTEPEAAVRLWMGTTGTPECLGPLLGNGRDLNMAPQYGEAEEQLCPRPQRDTTSPARNWALRLYNDCGQGHPEKNTPWAHTCCWKPCGNAIFLLGPQGRLGC